MTFSRIYLHHEPYKPPVFVFGSNLAGVHGAGAARYAVAFFGAVYGRGKGLYGNSYALPTKDANIKTLPLADIKQHVKDFLAFASEHPDRFFMVSPIGTGYAGYKHADIAPFFKDAPMNCMLPAAWAPYLDGQAQEDA